MAHEVRKGVRDLVCGMAAFEATRCGEKCIHDSYRVGVQRWVASIRRHTVRERTDVILFTGRRNNSIARDRTIASVLAAGNVSVRSANFADGPGL